MFNSYSSGSHSYSDLNEPSDSNMKIILERELLLKDIWNPILWNFGKWKESVEVQDFQWLPHLLAKWIKFNREDRGVQRLLEIGSLKMISLNIGS